ncbi:MAG: hypothetical protein QM658_13635 [Gordonia sp. (in: high G+C Gram-positive bacteria)]
MFLALLVAVLLGLAALFAAAALCGAVLAAGGIPTRTDNYDDDPDHAPPLRGGRVIGVLERVAVTTCLLLAWPAGIASLVM